jgi:glycerophosphoryl diester phosphodiesterase
MSAAMADLDWLTARPVAHRGLHDAAAGVIENTPTAFNAAIRSGFAIECDVQITADGEAMVHHDATLGRLTCGEGRLAAMTADGLKQVPFRATQDGMITLPELCDLVADQVPLLVEMKSQFDGDVRVARRAATVLAGYRGRAALMSFDPEMVESVRRYAPDIPRGIVAERRYDGMTRLQQFALGALLHAPSTQPQFVAYKVADLPTFATRLARSLLHCPLLTWTVRTADDRARAARYADQMVFEGFRP